MMIPSRSKPTLLAPLAAIWLGIALLPQPTSAQAVRVLSENGSPVRGARVLFLCEEGCDALEEARERVANRSRETMPLQGLPGGGGAVVAITNERGEASPLP